MPLHLFLPGDDLVDQTLAEFMGYTWCCYGQGPVVGERVVRFLVSPEQFEEANTKFGAGSVVPASGTEPVEQLAFKAVPAYHADRNAMAQVESKFYRLQLHGLYRSHLRGVLSLPQVGALNADQDWTLFSAEPKARAQAAFILVDSQRPPPRR